MTTASPDPLRIAADRLRASVTDDPIAKGRRGWWCDNPDCDGQPHDTYTTNHARAAQRTPVGDWYTWLILAGRGFGKTRTGAEDMARYMIDNQGVRCAIVAPRYADGRDTCVEGESGILAVLDRYGHTDQNGRRWNRSLGELILTNGSRAKLFSAEAPDALRGPQHHRVWVDELAQVLKRNPDTWSQVMFGLRLGRDPRAIVTTTPLPLQGIRELLTDDHCVVTRGSTYDNAGNLAAPALAKLRSQYEGTRLGRQELDGALMDDVPGALWARAWLDRDRVWRPPTLDRVVVAVDPAVTSGEDSDETGIVVAGVGPIIDGHRPVWVLRDASLRATPDAWARRVDDMYREYDAAEVVIETNQGGDALIALLRTVNPNLPITKVIAKKGKRVRAEPVSALYEQGKVHHVGKLDTLEDQLCTWTPDDPKSPDRLDALVYAVLQLTGGGRASAFFTALRKGA